MTDSRGVSFRGAAAIQDFWLEKCRTIGPCKCSLHLGAQFGFGCYFLYNAMFFYNSGIREAYREEHDNKDLQHEPAERVA